MTWIDGNAPMSGESPGKLYISCLKGFQKIQEGMISTLEGVFLVVCRLRTSVLAEIKTKNRSGMDVFEQPSHECGKSIIQSTGSNCLEI